MWGLLYKRYCGIQRDKFSIRDSVARSHLRRRDGIISRFDGDICATNVNGVCLVWWRSRVVHFAILLAIPVPLCPSVNLHNINHQPTVQHRKGGTSKVPYYQTTQDKYSVPYYCRDTKDTTLLRDTINSHIFYFLLLLLQYISLENRNKVPQHCKWDKRARKLKLCLKYLYIKRYSK